MKERRSRGRAEKLLKNYYVLYTLCFLGLFTIVAAKFIISGKSLIWSHDGVPQHLNALSYWGEYLREFFRNLFIEHRWVLPQWDLNIGYGSDILTTLHYYVIGDPLTLLSAFVPEAYTEILYDFLIILRIYLAGISFSGFCFYHKNGKKAVLLGALVYVFCGWSMYAVIKHPYFANPMIYLPLILKGIDRIYHKEKPHLFIGAVSIAAVSNFYFFYMIGIFMVLYAAFRYFMIFSKIRIKEVASWFLKFAGYFFIGLMLSSVIFVPVCMSLFGTQRMGVQNYVPVLYDAVYYQKFLGSLTGENMSHWGVAGFSVLSIAAVLVMFSKKKKYQAMKAGVVLLTGMLLVPFAGHMLNGFSYVSNRWIWAYGMLLAYVFVKVYPEFFVLDKNEKKRLTGILCVYLAAAVLFETARTPRNLCGLLLLTVCVFGILSYGWLIEKPGKLIALLSVCLTAGVAFHIQYQYSFEKNYLNEFAGSGKTLSKLETAADEAAVKEESTQDNIYRYDQYGTQKYNNSSMNQKTNSTSYYFSLANGNISQYFNEMYLNTPWEQRYEGLDGRSILEVLASVRSYIVHSEDSAYVPYGYDQKGAVVEKEGDTYQTYNHPDALPLGYTYDSVIDPQDYEAMTVEEKQQAVLQAAVVQDDTLPEAGLSFEDRQIPWEAKEGNGCEFQDGKFTVTEENAQITLQFSGLDESETYLIFENLEYTVLSPVNLYTEEEWENLDEYTREEIQEEEFQWQEEQEDQKSAILVDDGQVKKKVQIFTDKYNAYSGKHNFLCNLGYQKEGKSQITLTFTKCGIYSVDELRISCQPVENSSSYIQQRGEEVLEEIAIGDNSISGSITVDRDKILVLSVPYSTGWNVSVDGKEQELKKVNTMFMGVKLSQGDHKVEFRYCTPYLRQGAVISILGAVLWLVVAIVQRKQKWFFGKGRKDE